MPNTPTLLTTAEVATRLRISQRTVTRWAETEQLTTAAIANGIRLFDPAVVAAKAQELASDAEALAAALRSDETQAAS